VKKLIKYLPTAGKTTLQIMILMTERIDPAIGLLLARLNSSQTITIPFLKNNCRNSEKIKAAHFSFLPF
jgi:hypothetical protein